MVGPLVMSPLLTRMPNCSSVSMICVLHALEFGGVGDRAALGVGGVEEVEFGQLVIGEAHVAAVGVRAAERAGGSPVLRPWRPRCGRRVRRGWVSSWAAAATGLGTELSVILGGGQAGEFVRLGGTAARAPRRGLARRRRPRPSGSGGGTATPCLRSCFSMRRCSLSEAARGPFPGVPAAVARARRAAARRSRQTATARRRPSMARRKLRDRVQAGHQDERAEVGEEQEDRRARRAEQQAEQSRVAASSPTSHAPTRPPGPWALKSRVPTVQEPGLELRQARAAEHEQRPSSPAAASQAQAGQEEFRPAEAEQQRGHEERRRAEEKEVQPRDDRADGADEVLRRGVGRGVLAEGHPVRQVAGHVGNQREVEQHPVPSMSRAGMSLQAEAAGGGLATGRAMGGRVLGMVAGNGETESPITAKGGRVFAPERRNFNTGDDGGHGDREEKGKKRILSAHFLPFASPSVSVSSVSRVLNSAIPCQTRAAITRRPWSVRSGSTASKSPHPAPPGNAHPRRSPRRARAAEFLAQALENLPHQTPVTDQRPRADRRHRRTPDGLRGRAREPHRRQLRRARGR